MRKKVDDMRLWMIMAVAVILALTTVQARAAHICSGQVSNLAIGPTNGLLQVNYGHGWHYICSFKAAHNGVDPEVCKIWWSMLLSAQSLKKEIHFYYDDSLGGCSNLPNWATPVPSPYFVKMDD